MMIMPDQRRFRLSVALSSALALGPVIGEAVAQDFEAWDDQRASAVLPAELLAGPYHRVKDKVVSYGYQNFYEVSSDFGAFSAQGDAMLRRLVREIHAIAALKEISQTDAFVAATKDAVVKYGVGVKMLVTDPVDTISGIPQGLFSIFNRVGDRLTTDRTDYEDSHAKALLAVSSFKRDMAAAYNVDVYSSNPVLQEELNRVGWGSAVGNLTPGTASLAVSGPAILALSQARNVQILNTLLTELPPGELSLRNRKAMETMGIGEAVTDAFLDHQSYSPRHKTVIVESLTAMDGAQGRQAFVEAALAAESEVGALFFQQVAETIAGYHRTVSPVAGIETWNGVPIAYAQNRSLVVAFPADRARWTIRSAPLARALSDQPPQAFPVEKVEVWITGTFSDRARQEFTTLGLALTEDADQKLDMMD